MATTYSVSSPGDDTGSTGLRIVRINIIDQETQEAIEEVDTWTSADAVLFENNNDLNQELDERFAYTNKNPTTTTVGGIDKGTTFDAVEIKDILTDLLYPYVAPTVSLKSTATSSYYEKGISISPVTFTLTADVTSDDVVAAYLYRGSTRYAQFENFPARGGSGTYAYTEALSTTTSFYASLEDGVGTYTTSTLRIVFNDPVYIGVVDPTAEITETMVKSLTKRINYSNVNSISMSIALSPQEQAFCFAYKVYSGNNETITVYDTNNYNITSSFTSTVIDLVDASGATVEYKVWRSNMTTQSNFTITINIRNS